jgi:hypothetical protein
MGIFDVYFQIFHPLLCMWVNDYNCSKYVGLIIIAPTMLYLRWH